MVIRKKPHKPSQTAPPDGYSTATALEITPLPRHVAIIMDGNGRWAKRHHLSRLKGHNKGAANAQSAVQRLIEYGIPYVTLFVFSTENWNRPKIEVNGLFKLLDDRLDEGLRIAQEMNVRICHLGELNGLPGPVKKKLAEVIELTRNNSATTVNLAFNYGARAEIVEATRNLVRSGIAAEDIDEQVISRYLYTAHIPDPDLIIRTGGEMRLSNFMLWQAAYAEIYSTTVLWPDFDDHQIDKALLDYSKRQRRFGKISGD
jgi:undecaprenyl diphosphate synthase